jgi:endonuclease/exonuclease/phosphatase (EEP) superfamily protein YafD
VRLLRNTARAFPFVYVILILVWLGLWLATGDDLWWMALLNRIVVPLFVPALLAILLALVSHQNKAFIVSLVPPLIFGGLFWPYLIPRPVPNVGQPILWVMTYNVLYSNSNYDAVANVIRTYQPDLVALQEVQPQMMSELTARLQDLYPFSLRGHEHPYGTTATFSRYPVISSRVLSLELDRSAVVLQVDVKGAQVTFISAHLLAYGLQWVALPEIPQAVRQRVSDQNRQASLLIAEVQKHGGTVLLACDCNSKETSASYRMLARVMTNAAWTTGWRIGAPALAGTRQDTDVQHIDYVFYRGAVKPVQVYTIQDPGGSDHLPVLAIFAASIS